MKGLGLWGSAVGLALLYTSAFYLPQIGIESAYWLPEVGAQILYPSVIALLLLTPAAAWWLWRGYADGRGTSPVGLVVFAALCLIALIGAFSAAGYSALSLAMIVTGGAVDIQTTRWVRIALVVAGIAALIVALRAFRPHWSSLLRALAILGYAYAALALIRLIPYPRSAFAIRNDASVRAADPGAASSPELGNAAAVPRARQVVWIIFDELDYNMTLGLPGGPRDPPMPNLAKLARSGVSATAAYSPARDTEVSIPALLSGYEPVGVKYDDRGDLWLETRNHGVKPFAQSESVFGRLPRGPQSAAIIGYYHPYCVLFPAAHPCEAFPEANVGRWFDALSFFGQQAIATTRMLPESAHYMPGGLFRIFEPMYRISEDTVRDMPRFLALDDQSLVFIHVNLPHTPGDYVQRALHFNSVAADRENYHRNLQLVDQLIAQAVDTLQRRSARQDILLIVSADHWWRMISPNDVQRIPWIAWHVGESEGSALATRISTVHTADLVLDFLQGHVDNQAQIVPWWDAKSFYPPLMPSHYRYQF